MKFEHTEVWGFEHALRGMRNPMNSWDKSDSKYHELTDEYIVGENDMKLAQSLIQGGSEHRKFLRQIFVSVDITAPIYFWKEFDTYKVGTTAKSTSTMHKLATTPITLECFELDDCNVLDEFSIQTPCQTQQGEDFAYSVSPFITFLEALRKKYLETKDKRYWKELIRWLPESWLQTRTITMNYENILNMYHQRKSHKLNEWSGIDDPTKPNFISWVKTLPYAKEFIIGGE
ncbi:MAG: hypothetical protein NC452_05940 [Eubacterium sp.]|nr:hypothetical protein [Eubacterium sp.]